MKMKTQFISLYTIIRREWLRMVRIAGQVFVPPVITMSLYFLIFGELLGKRVGDIEGYPYATYIAPGLIMMSVITNSYSNVSGSFFGTRFQRHIEELLVSPTPNFFILLGYVMGGVIRGLAVAFLVTLVTLFFIPFHISHPFITILVVFMVALFFSLAGFANALYAKSFDDIMLIPTFVLTPLTYLGGVFYSVDMLSPFWHAISSFNPILYMVGSFRYGMLGITDVSVVPALLLLTLCIVILTTVNMVCLNRGIGLKD